ncbi:MAG: hypothetical protein ABI833_12270 [Acidobacteriota bacterium]
MGLRRSGINCATTVLSVGLFAQIWSSPIIHQDAPDRYSVVQNLETLQGTNTLALDLKTGKVYLSTNKFVLPTTGQGKATRIPASFMVAVYGAK